ncbi:hypothetical protein FIBSPDRAFT_1054631 [Athelia psychrophila]|uniref:RBR-type E3 ubiquitin transferase n=1 Tax=Athelia psychrophila TaxID=1759441 RepID=A0A167V0D8_9AGAM|nr:hypothetical protein FIBSPDRAFT_1054631 [Fibularhizoctonia sp. CBS 109695]
MATEPPAGKPQVAVPKNRPRCKRNNQMQHVQVTDNLELNGKCRFFIQGHCEFGDLCKRSHGDSPGEVTTSPTVRVPTDVSQTEIPDHTSSTPVTTSNVLGHPTTSSASTLSRPNARSTTPHSNRSPGTSPNNQVKKPCFSWAKSGTCRFGSKCRYGHNVNGQLELNRNRQARNDETRLAREVAEAEVAGKRQQAQEEAAAERARQAALRQAEVEHVRGRAQQALEQAELLEWDRVHRTADIAQKARQVQQAQEGTAADAADRVQQEAVSRIEEARRAREAAEAGQKAQVDAARQAEARRTRKTQQEEERRVRQAEQEREAVEAALKVQQQENAARQAEIRRAREAQQEEARQSEQEARMVELAKEEAAMTMQHIVLDFTVVTFSAGLAIRDVLLGFESCRITIKNLPTDATIEEVCEFFIQQGIEASRIHVLGLARTPAGKQEAFLIGHEDLKMVAIALEEVDFRKQRLSFEFMGHSSGGDGMRASAFNTNALTLTWQAPSVAYIVTCMDGAQAQAKVRELDRRKCLGRRVKAQINQCSQGRQVLLLGFPPEVADQEVMTMVGSDQVERRKPVNFDTTQAAEFIRRHIDSIPGVQITRFEQVILDSAGGTYSARVHFGSWTQTRDVFNNCAQQCFPFIGNNTFCWLRLPDPIQYTITISASQYRAQRKLWNDLLATVQGKAGLKLWIVLRDRAHIVHVGGEDRKAVGSLKVRVNSIAAGEKLEGWHPSLSLRFMDRVLQDTGALLRIDRRLRVVKAYGERGSIEAARALVNSALALLESQEQTMLLKRQSVRFFVTRGLAILKEELGDDNVTLNVSSVPANITIKGGDAAMHTLSRLMEESLDASNIVPRSRDTEEALCPICYDAVTLPIKLGCGHAYCSACIRHFLTSASTFPLVCMGDEDKCHVPIPIPVFQRFLPIQQFTNLLETAFITHIDHHPQDFKYCTTPDCRQVYRCTASDTASIMHCPSCLSSVCSACHEGGHEGMTCGERKQNNDPEEQERLNDELATQPGFKKCPQCTVWIEKTEGCNHMSCKCGAHICWVCMGIFNAQSVYEHMNTAHGGIYEELPFQPGAFAEQQGAPHLIALHRARLAQQQFYEVEDAQHRRAQQLLYPRQAQKPDNARTQNEARRAELAQQQRQEAEGAQHRLAQQLLHARRVREQEEAHIQEEARAAEFAQQQRQEAEDAQHRLAKQLLHARQVREEEDAIEEEARTAALAQQQRHEAEFPPYRLAQQRLYAMQVRKQEAARMQEEARTAELAQQQRHEAEFPPYRLAQQLLYAMQVREQEGARIQEEARAAELTQQQRHDAEFSQHRLAKELLYARQIREQEDARIQEEARTAELAQQQRQKAENAQNRLAQQLAQQARKQVKQQSRQQPEYDIAHRPNSFATRVEEVRKR